MGGTGWVGGWGWGWGVGRGGGPGSGSSVGEGQRWLRPSSPTPFPVTSITSRARCQQQARTTTQNPKPPTFPIVCPPRRPTFPLPDCPVRLGPAPPAPPHLSAARPRAGCWQRRGGARGPRSSPSIQCTLCGAPQPAACRAAASGVGCAGEGPGRCWVPYSCSSSPGCLPSDSDQRLVRCNRPAFAHAHPHNPPPHPTPTHPTPPPDTKALLSALGNTPYSTPYA